jgi:hypothetical protein
MTLLLNFASFAEGPIFTTLPFYNFTILPSSDFIYRFHWRLTFYSVTVFGPPQALPFPVRRLSCVSRNLICVVIHLLTYYLVICDIRYGIYFQLIISFVVL